MPSTQRPYFLSSFIAAFRQQGPSLQANKHTTATSSAAHTTAASSSNPHSATSYHHHHQHHTHQQPSASSSPPVSSSTPTASAAAPRTISSAAVPAAQATRSSPSPGVGYHSPRTAGGIPIPGGGSPGHRRGSDSSSEGFREALGADKWYIGGRTAGGEEKFFKLGVVRRVRSNDGLSLDRLSL